MDLTLSPPAGPAKLLASGEIELAIAFLAVKGGGAVSEYARDGKTELRVPAGSPIQLSVLFAPRVVRHPQDSPATDPTSSNEKPGARPGS